MEATSITCPNCGANVPLTAALEARIKTELQAQMAGAQAELRKREQALQAAQENMQADVKRRVEEQAKVIVAEQQAKARETVALQLSAMQTELKAKDEKVRQMQQQELQLLKDKQALREAQDSFELEKARQIEAEREKIRQEALGKATQASAAAMEQLRAELAVKEQRLKEAQDAELKLRQERAELEEQKKAMDLEVARRTDEAKQVVARQKDEEYRLREAENQQKMASMMAQIDELKRKAEQSSQQAQGEALELDLESALRRCFNEDEIVPVGKGERGADVLQHVRNELRQSCGTIIWETKRTRSWSEGWLQKLKDDALAAKASVAVIVSVAMPKGVSAFECRENVWVTVPHLALPLAGALRMTLLETAAARRASDGQHGKMEIIYNYISGQQFRARVLAIAESFKEMQEELTAERRAYARMWAKREKLLERVMNNTLGLYGDVSGVIGADLPAIEMMDLPALPEGSA